MPIGINQGDVVNFTVELQSSAGAPSVPSLASLTLTYISTSGAPATTTISLTNTNGGTFTGSWDTSVASLGPVGYTIISGSVAASTGQLQIVTP